MDYSILLFTILKLGILLGIGIWLTSKISFTKEVRRFLIFVIINIALPAIILNGFFRVNLDDSLMKQIVIIFIFSLAFNINVAIYKIHDISTQCCSIHRSCINIFKY